MSKFFSAVILLLICCLSANANIYDFKVDTTYWAGHDVVHFSEFRGRAVVLLDNDSVYLINQSMESQSISNSISAEIRADISCFQMIAEEIFLFGTNTHSLFLYDHGEITSFKQNGLPARINDIDVEPYNYNYFVVVATSHGAYYTNDLKSYLDYEYGFSPTSVEFLDGRDVAMISGYSYCKAVPGNYGVYYAAPYYTVVYRLNEGNSITHDEINDVTYFKRFGSSNSGGYGTYARYATDSGLYVQYIYSCSTEAFWQEKREPVYDFEYLSRSKSYNQATLMATEKGLFYSYLDDPETTNLVYPKYHQVSGIEKAYKSHYSEFHNNIFVATNDGLKIMTEIELTPVPLIVPNSNSRVYSFCKDIGFYFRSTAENGFDIRWLKDGKVIANEYRAVYSGYEEGEYAYVLTSRNGVSDTVQVGTWLLENEFDETISVDKKLVCPGEFSNLSVSNYDYDREYWLKTTDGSFNYELNYENTRISTSGEYYVQIVNCNGFTHNTDTVSINTSQLQEPSFENWVNSADYCHGDIITLENDDIAEEIDWSIDGSVLEGYHENYLILDGDTYGFNSMRINVTYHDNVGCSISKSFYVDDIQRKPEIYFAPDDLIACDSTPVEINLSVNYGKAIWAGYDGTNKSSVVPGTYEVALTNSYCSDSIITIEIAVYDDPHKDLEESYTLMTGEKFVIPLAKATSLGNYFWSGPFKYDRSLNALTITSDVDTTLVASFALYDICETSHEFRFTFRSEPLSTLGETQIQIYPNPATELVNIIGLKNQYEKLQLFDLSGQLRLEQSVSQLDQLTLPLDKMTAGTYFIRLSGTELKTLKLHVR